MVPPRLVLAAANSSAGKTTISIGLLAALTARGLRVAPFKVGPDYIDPGYHALATGRPGRNLDAWLCGTRRIAPLLAHGTTDADIAVVEGVMGLYDGRLGITEGRHGFGSTAHIASLLQAPVVLVLDASGVSRTLAATALGLARHPDAPKVAGVILNKTGSARAVDELRDAFDQIGLPVLGAVPRDRDLVVPSRHLGLVPAEEQDQARAVVEAAAALVAAHVDLDAVLAIAGSAPALGAEPWRPEAQVKPVAGRPRIAVAGGRAFTFRYAETTELLLAAGCEVIEFDPLTDPALPVGTGGLYLGGGFPEVYAEELAANRALLAEIRAAVEAGLPTIAECAGLLYLGRSLDGIDLAGVLPLDAQFSPRLTLGYHTLTAATDSVATRAGEQVRSHEFHRTTTRPAPDAATPPAAWLVDGSQTDGVAGTRLLASYQHVHWAGHPQLAQRFAQSAADFGDSPSSWQAPTGLRPLPAPDLRHHGDAQTRRGLVDLAVNVHPAPDWLLTGLTRAPGSWRAYPDATPARHALADRYRLEPGQVLPTAGAADAFTLMARTFPARRVTIIHPQFTEPELAWRLAGHQVRRLLLRPGEGFRLDADRIGEQPDLIVIGNPTNPTGVLHPAAEIRRLVRPGRIVVVDEAFMDFVPGETQSLLGGDLTGILVTRSLTKLWGIAGLRAGFVAGDGSLIAELAAHQEPWAVATPALDAIMATSTPRAGSHAARVVEQVTADRAALVNSLAALGFPVAGDPQTPFVLVDTSAIGPDSVHEELADAGFAVRRCDSFPGLGPSWIRLAVKDAQTSRAVANCLARLRETACAAHEPADRRAPQSPS